MASGSFRRRAELTRATAWTSNATGIQTFDFSFYPCRPVPDRARPSFSSRSLSPRGVEAQTTPSSTGTASRRQDPPGEHLLLARSGSPWGQDLHVWTRRAWCACSGGSVTTVSGAVCTGSSPVRGASRRRASAQFRAFSARPKSPGFPQFPAGARCAWTGLGQEPGHGVSIVDWSAGSTRTLAMGPARSVVFIPEYVYRSPGCTSFITS